MRIPLATYRLQFNQSFGFKDAQKTIAYLNNLGISDIYASPIFKAKKESLHGYDIVDPTQLNPELGTVQDFEELCGEVKCYSMGWLQDIVPNHMAYDGENALLMDVLENGQSSEYLDFFDTDWEHPYESIRERVLAPFLGRLYGESLEEGEITLQYDSNGFTINYYDLKFPLKIESYTSILTYKLGTLKKRLGEDHPDYIKLLGILYSLKNLPTSKEETNERYNQITFVKRMLWELYTKNPDIKSFIIENMWLFNGEKGHSDSYNLLDNLLSEQLFRLSFWKVATQEINYRRFFNINGLISLRMEKDSVFDYAHSLILELIKEGKFTGLRIDHVDGLYDPTNYLKNLSTHGGEIYIIVEKILELEEELPAFWEVQGTTGYDFLNYVNGIFCERKNETKFNKIYSKFTGIGTSYMDLVYEKKRLLIGKHMAGDIDNLAHLLKSISSRDRYGSDITLYGLRRALVEVLVLFPVYRTYISQEVFSETDCLYIKESIRKAKDRYPDLLYELSFIEKFLLLEFKEHITEEEKKERVHFVMRFQQLTGPLMAKGFEDTVLYIYNKLLSLNEVGASLDKFGISLKEFHNFNTKRHNLWPHSMNATSTHDTKRGEDIRARINVLSEIPEEWENNIKKWHIINKKKKRRVRGKNVPDSNDEYFFYQTLVGALPFYQEEHPAFIERIKAYLIKAVREAKVHTAWLKPDIDYEDAFLLFTEETLKYSEQNLFLKEFLPFQRKVAHYGIFNSLAQTLIKLTCPGVPDFYQGTDLWDLNLVDPDNRRPVDFEKRMSFLQAILPKEKEDIAQLIKELLLNKEDGRIKLFLIYRALKARNEKTEMFTNGAYIPLEVGGKFKEHVVAFARKSTNSWAISIAPRFLTSLIKEGELPIGEHIWNDTYIVLPEDAPSLWRDAITTQMITSERTLPIAILLGHFPVALLVSD